MVSDTINTNNEASHSDTQIPRRASTGAGIERIEIILYGNNILLCNTKKYS